MEERGRRAGAQPGRRERAGERAARNPRRSRCRARGGRKRLCHLAADPRGQARRDHPQGSAAMGPLANHRRIETIEAMVADATAKGARLLAGGSRIGNRGYYYPLTVLADLPDDTRAMREEPFGPLALINPVASLDEAIRRRTPCPTGLPRTPSRAPPRTPTASPKASRWATSRLTTASPQSPRRPSEGSRNRATAAKAAPRASLATRW